MRKKGRFIKCKSCLRPIKNIDGSLRFPTQVELDSIADGFSPKQICNECFKKFSGTSLLDVVKELEGIGQHLQKNDDDDSFTWFRCKQDLNKFFEVDDKD